MDISEVARKSGVAASALRYYERKGLIHSLESEGARRKFAPAVLDQLALIALGQAAGFSLNEIRVMCPPGAGSPTSTAPCCQPRPTSWSAWSST